MAEKLLKHVKIDKIEGEAIWVLAIDNPPANLLTLSAFDEMESIVDRLATERGAKVLILTGSGERAFSAGAELDSIMKIKSPEEGVAVIRRVQRLFNKIEGSEKPIIAAINNLCLGGGSELAMACHIRIASERAKFAQPEINLGIIPGWGGTQRLARLIGASKARKMILTGDMISAQEAFQFGLVDEVVAHGKALEAAIDLARRIIRNGQMGVRLCQRAIYRGMNETLTAGLETEIECFREVCQTEDMREGLQAYKEKRPPVFKDK